MKITLTLSEALKYIRDHEDFEFLTDAEFVIEGFEEAAPVAVQTEEDKPKQTRKRRTKKEIEADKAVSQDDVNEIVAEVEAELETDEVITSSDNGNGASASTVETDSDEAASETLFADTEMQLIDEVLAEEEEIPLVEQPVAPEILDLDAPLFG